MRFFHHSFPVTRYVDNSSILPLLDVAEISVIRKVRMPSYKKLVINLTESALKNLLIPEANHLEIFVLAKAAVRKAG